MSLPEPGDLDWGPAVNDAIESAQSDAADAASNANNAVGTANYARQRVDGMGLATASQVVDAIENEPSVQTALSASYVPHRDTPPSDHAATPVYVDTSVTPPVLKVWDTGTSSWVLGAGGGIPATDNGLGGITTASGSVSDNSLGGIAA